MPASDTAHSTDAGFGIENVKSNPATAFRDPFDGIAATNKRGDYAIRDIAISRLR